MDNAAVASPATSNEAEEPVAEAQEEAPGQEVGVTTAETAVGNEIFETEEMTRHHSEMSGVGSVMSTGGAAKGTVFVADEHPQAHEGRHLAEILENENLQ